jgi:aminopeptidase YwaD
MADDGGAGYNVVAELPGSAANGEMVVIGGHHDAHFRAGADDTGAVSATLTMAKAMKMSGYTPKRTIVFFFDTAEEYGYTDCYFDWIIGAWYAITKEHTDWPGKAVAYINLESMAEKGGSVTADGPAEIAPFLKRASTPAASGLPGGAYVSGSVSSWSNGWTFTAAGVPTITLSATKDDYWKKYHTDYEVDANLDWQLLGKIVKYTAKLQAGLDEGAPPYNLAAGAAYVAKGVKVAELKAAGADPAAIARLTKAAAAYASAAKAADARVAAMTPEQQTAVSGDLMAIEKTYCNGLLALSIWEEQILPHQQVAYDAAMMRATLAALKAGKKSAALESLVEVSNTWNAYFVDQEVYEQDNARWAPDFDKLTWGAQSHLPPVLNVWPQYELIKKGQLSKAAGQLQPVLDSEMGVLNDRLNETADLLEGLTSQTEALQ